MAVNQTRRNVISLCARTGACLPRGRKMTSRSEDQSDAASANVDNIIAAV